MDVRTRLSWIRLYEELGNAGVVCRRCGISRPTLRKWWHRYRTEGEAGLESRSRRPHHSPKRKVFEHEEGLILALRRERRPGVKRLRIELIREHGLRLALDTIHKVLVRHGECYLQRRLLRRKGSKRFNGKVERAQRTALEEFWATADLECPSLGDELAEWQTFFNWQRPHSALGGRAPIDRICELLPNTPLTEPVWDAYDPGREPIRIQDHHWDTTVARRQR